MILLDTPYNPGDGDPGQMYTHVRVASCVLNARQSEIGLSVDYLYDPGDGFVRSVIRTDDIGVDGDDFHLLKKFKVKKNDDIIREWLAACEQLLIDQGIFVGTIIDDPLLDDPVVEPEPDRPLGPTPPPPE